MFPKAAERDRWNDTLTRLINRIVQREEGKTKTQVMSEVGKELRQHFNSYPDEPTIRINQKGRDGFQVMVTIHKVGKLKMDFTVRNEISQ